MEEEKNLNKIDENNNIKEEKENKENNMDKAKEEIKEEVKEENKENKNEDNDKKDEQKTKKEDNNNEKENDKEKNKEEIDTKVKKENKENKENKDNLYKESTEPFMQIASKELIELINNPENRKCFDCESSPANWLCVNNAIFLCSKCAGEHRGYGTIISNLKLILLFSLILNILKLLIGFLLL